MEKAEKIANKIWKLSRDKLMIHLRFLDASLANLSLQASFGIESLNCNGSVIMYNPIFVLNSYKNDTNSIARSYLHILFHCIFNHMYRYDKVEKDLWDIAADMAVENAIQDLKLSQIDTQRDEMRKKVLLQWSEKVGALTAERIYRQLRKEPLDSETLYSLSVLFGRDKHDVWQQQEVLEISQAQWKKISERVKAELKSFSQDKSNKGAIVQNLEEATREHYDYGDFLKKFCARGEDMQINDDEFDYVYYTYGLQLYGNLPLVEPLEYKDLHKIKEFVIAIDTSGSCRGKVVQAFLNKTYDILKSSENFFRKVNIHIIQCDSQVRSDTKITCDEDFELFMKNGQLEGFGATDFRPVFEYVNKCIENGEFENLKGLIYFTDGYGIFPEQKPLYDAAFVFLDDGFEIPMIPPWAIKLVLPTEDDILS